MLSKLIVEVLGGGVAHDFKVGQVGQWWHGIPVPCQGYWLKLGLIKPIEIES